MGGDEKQIINFIWPDIAFKFNEQNCTVFAAIEKMYLIQIYFMIHNNVQNLPAVIIILVKQSMYL